MTTATPPYDPAFFAPGPKRDPRFRVVDRWIECDNFPEGDPRREVEFLHRQMNEEVNGMENAARALADFPGAPWELRMSIARQCCDEARHVQMFRREFERRGGRVGQYPVMNFQFRIITKVDTLIGRLAVQNRAFEAEGVDAVEPEIAVCRKRGDHDLAALFDFQLADEIGHVRFANEYIAKASANDPRNLMGVGRAIGYANQAFSQVMGKEASASITYATNEQGRLEAGFTPEEVKRIAAAHEARKAASGS